MGTGVGPSVGPHQPAGPAIVPKPDPSRPARLKRVAKKGEWRANFHRGGKGFAYTPSQKEEKLAIRAAKAVGLNLCGVDIIKTDDGVKLLELNASPGLEEISRATGIDVADKLIEYIEGKV